MSVLNCDITTSDATNWYNVTIEAIIVSGNAAITGYTSSKKVVGTFSMKSGQVSAQIGTTELWSQGAAFTYTITPITGGVRIAISTTQDAILIGCYVNVYSPERGIGAISVALN